MFSRKISRNKNKNKRSIKILKYFNIIIMMIIIFAASFLALRLIFPGIYDSKCLIHFNWSTCLTDSVNYHISNLSGECYIKDYHIKGVPNETITLTMDIYVAENEKDKINLSNEEIRLIITDVNKTWNEYGIIINVNGIQRFVVNDSLIYAQDHKKLAIDIVGDNLFKDNDKSIDLILIPKFKMDFLFWRFDTGVEGLGFDALPQDNRTVSLIIAATKDVKNETWVISHELGHILGSYDYTYYSGQFNLMTESDCIKDIYHTTILNQRQVDSAMATAKKLLE